uniref:Ddb1 and cul4 associated factor 17 n=1 Tax=Amphilophus citrinellus TaxID=61819 RepID=A0A3Q0QTD7_AMPCI
MKVWSKTSKSTIMYENCKLYFENYQHCYSCVHAEPQILYKLPTRSKQEKIEDTLMCHSPIEKTLSSPSDHKPSLLALTANNWLIRLSAETGEELEKVYLSPNYKFRYLGWDVSQETFYVKSIQNKETPLARQAGITQNTVMHIAVFHVFPLEVIGIMEINKNVCIIFKNNLHVSNIPFFWSLILFKCFSLSLFFIYYFFFIQSPLLSGKTVGDAPFGIPLNIQITDCPPVLFKVSSAENSVQIGGNPWHYIYTPPRKKDEGTYHICSLEDVTVTSSGRTVKRRFQQLDDDPSQKTFRMVEYEDELDLLAIVVTNGEEGEGRAYIQLHDNQTGQLLRTIDLVETWDETNKNEVFFDKDMVVHIEQKNAKFCCHVYKLISTRS